MKPPSYIEATDKFTAAMKKRLRSKAAQGWHGWDSPGYKESISQRMLLNASHAHEHCDEKSLIDVANLAMMLWYQTCGNKP